MHRDNYERALERYHRGALSPAELACAFVIARARARGGARWDQGARRPALDVGDARLTDDVRCVAERRLLRVEEPAARALVGWARGERRVELRFDVPPVAHVLALQARGWRCVSLLPDGARTAPHEARVQVEREHVRSMVPQDSLAFALHDLCHLEKFSDPEHHDAQVGFFATMDRATRGARWAHLSSILDDTWRADVAHVAADMNGSPVFLMAALKMKLKMAARRLSARESGAPPRTSGPLADDEQRAYEAALESLLDALELHGDPREAARAVTATRAAPDAALRLVAYFAQIGRDGRAL